MHRRHFWLGGSTLTFSVLAGCLGKIGTESPVTIDGPEPTLIPGENIPVTVKAENVDGFSFALPFLHSKHIQASSFKVTPKPDSVGESFPPVWYWKNSQATLTAKMELHTTEDVEYREFVYRVNVSQGDKHQTRQFTITIRNPPK